jgi:hypothetical protein
MSSKADQKLKEEILEELRRLNREVACIHDDVQYLIRIASFRKIDFVPLGRHHMDFSIQAGSSGVFQAQLTPANGAQAPGSVPQWVASDPTVTLTPSTDGLSCKADVPASDSAASFDLKLTAVSADATIGTVSATHTIVVTQPGPPPPTNLQSIDFVQTS